MGNKAIETGMISLIDQVAAVIFVKLTKVSNFGAPKRFCINSINISMNIPGAAQWQPLLFSKHILFFMSIIEKIVPVSIALSVIRVSFTKIF